MLQIKTGRLVKPVKAVIYGLEGTGKTTLAALPRSLTNPRPIR